MTEYLDGVQGVVEPTDTCLYEMFNKIEFQGYVNPETSPLIVHIDARPFVPSWFCIKWISKAIVSVNKSMLT